MNITLRVWRQDKLDAPGRFVEYDAPDIESHASFLEMLDIVNERLTDQGEEPIAFDSDCREGICGMCGLMINGLAHGPQQGTATCQLHMRKFKDGDVITIEPWRAAGFPIIRDLVVDRSSFDRIIESVVRGRQGGEPQPAPPGPARTVDPGGGDGRRDGTALRVLYQPR